MFFLSTILIAAVTVPWAAATGLPAPCYNIQGQAYEGWLPCQGSDGSSACCSHNDFCLSNGLCLNAGDDNYYSQQGCTDANWAAPCTWHCPTMTGNYSELWLCGNAGSKYCCGKDASCCDGDASTLLNIDVFTALSRPGQTAVNTMLTTVTSTATSTSLATATVVVTTATVSATETVSATATVLPSSTTAAAAAAITDTDHQKDTIRSLCIGLSIGMFVCLVAGLGGGFVWGQRAAASKVYAARPPGTPSDTLLDARPLTGERPGEHGPTYPMVAGRAPAASTGYTFPFQHQHQHQHDLHDPHQPYSSVPGTPLTGDDRHGQHHPQAYAQPFMGATANAYRWPPAARELVGRASLWYGRAHELA